MKTNFEIRIAVPGDAEAISFVLDASFAEYEPLYTTEAFRATTPESDVIKNRFGSGEIWTAVLGGKVVGTISVVPANESLYVRSMAVLPEARGNKIGERLLEMVENFALENNFKRLTLSTAPFLDRAIRLYEKFGFVRTGFVDLHGTTLISMEKNL